MGLSRIDPNLDFAYIMTPEGAVMRRQDEAPSPETANQRLEKAGVPKRYLDASFDKLKELPEAKTAVKTAKEWAEAPLADRGFFFVGTPGVGKTYLAAAALRHKVEHGLLNARFLNVPLFLDQIRASFKFSDDSAQRDFEFVCNRASVVVLDDFGKERATDWATLVFPDPLNPVRIRKRFASSDATTRRMNSGCTARPADMKSAWHDATRLVRFRGVTEVIIFIISSRAGRSQTLGFGGSRSSTEFRWT